VLYVTRESAGKFLTVCPFYFLAHYGVTTVLGSTSDPFQPSVPLTALLARTPLAVPLTGRKRVPWPWRGTTPSFGMKILSFPNGGVVPRAAER
jgi:hypothetical protein